MATYTIADHVNLHFFQSSKFKSSIICILFRRPLIRQEATVNALLPNVLKAGCQKYPSIKEMNQYLEGLYGAVFDAQVIKKGEEQIIQFYIEVLNSQYDENLLNQALYFLFDVIFHPLLTEDSSFHEDIVASEKEKLQWIIEGRVNNKSDYAKQKCVEEMCKGEPFGIYGDGYTEDLAGITAKSLYDHYEHLLHTAKVEVVLEGLADIKSFSGHLQGIKSYLHTKADASAPPLFIYDKNHEVKQFEQHLGLSQGKICMGLRAREFSKGKKFLVLMMLNEILGGGGNSKLFVNVREKEQICYHISSFVYRFKSIVMIQCGVDQKDIEKAVKLILNEIEQIKNGVVSEAEMASAKNSLTKLFKGLHDYPQQLIDFNLSQHILGDTADLGDFVSYIQDITLNEIISCANTLYLDTIYTID